MAGENLFFYTIERPIHNHKILETSCQLVVTACHFGNRLHFAGPVNFFSGGLKNLKMDDENEELTLEEDYYAFLNVSRNVSPKQSHLLRHSNLNSPNF
jgi:hypothetical protein